MFYYCTRLNTIYAGREWSTAAVTSSNSMFGYCGQLVGGMGTTFSSDHTDAEYAHLDGGPNNPGYFTVIPMGGDVNGDGSVTIKDVTALIDYLLSGDAMGINLDAADCNGDGQIKINDVTALIDYLLSGAW